MFVLFWVPSIFLALHMYVLFTMGFLTVNEGSAIVTPSMPDVVLSILVIKPLLIFSQKTFKMGCLDDVTLHSILTGSPYLVVYWNCETWTSGSSSNELTLYFMRFFWIYLHEMHPSQNMWVKAIFKIFNI